MSSASDLRVIDPIRKKKRNFKKLLLVLIILSLTVASVSLVLGIIRSAVPTSITSPDDLQDSIEQLRDDQAALNFSLQFLTNKLQHLQSCSANQLTLETKIESVEADLQALNSSIRPRIFCGNGDWRQVSFIDMTNPAQHCPPGFLTLNQTEAPFRTCGRPPENTDYCVSVTFLTNGLEYTSVCGRVIAYQVGSPSSFRFQDASEDFYSAGVSLTHGSQRKHIWSFVNGAAEQYAAFPLDRCPCSGGTKYNGTIPAFIRNDYFCDSALEGTLAPNGVLYADDPLWDGAGCGATRTCCQFNNPPWFSKQLDQPTTDDIELRLCENTGSHADDSPIEIIELYVK